MNGGGGGNNGGNVVGPGHVRLWSGGADGADVTADLAQAPDDINLGRLARACSSYCHAGVDGLDLWMSFREVSGYSSSTTTVLYSVTAVYMCCGVLRLMGIA